MGIAFFFTHFVMASAVAGTADGVKITLIDARGRTSEVAAQASHGWKNGEPPQLWVEFSLPSPLLIKKVSAKGAELQDQGPRWVRLGVLRSDPVINLTVVEESKPDLPLSVLVDYHLSEFKAWSDSLCRRAFVEIVPKGESTSGVHAGATCAVSDGALVVKLVASEDLRVPSETLRVTEDRYKVYDTEVLKNIKLQSGGKSRDVDVVLRPPRPRFRLRAALAPTFSYFRETPATVTLSDFGVGAGLWARYSIGKFSAELGGFASFVQFLQISSETTRPIWIDAVGHLFYHTPWKLGSFGVNLLAGASLLHMVVPSNLYGISLTVGPEIGFELQQDLRVLTPPRWRIHGRFGMLAFSPISITAALQVNYRINSFESKLPLFLRAEGRYFTAGSSTVSNTATGIFSSLGLSADLL